ncbi:hypothetical protein FB645_001808 [Coemansia sp. IMI 203386]|nr:hypothetical protein FB645_001808 [Coemansia sp. IMI 203386]
MDRGRHGNALHHHQNNNNTRAEAYEMADNDEAINNPVVFSCAKCRTILGDTFSYAASLPAYNLFGLESVPPSVTTNPIKKTTDLGVYHELTCNECQTPIGRQYLTTTSELDQMRNLFALDLSKLITYELGKCLRGDSQRVSQPPVEFYSSVEMHDDLVMVKNNVAAIAKRLQMLEQVLARNSAATSPRAAGASRKRQSTGTAELNYVDSSKRFGR